jgi:hypothetical protein
MKRSAAVFVFVVMSASPQAIANRESQISPPPEPPSDRVAFVNTPLPPRLFIEDHPPLAPLPLPSPMQRNSPMLSPAPEPPSDTAIYIFYIGPPPPRPWIETPLPPLPLPPPMQPDRPPMEHSRGHV